VRLSLLIVAGTAVTLLGTGCGDDDGEEPTVATTTAASEATGATGPTGPAGAEPLSSEAWIRGADSICAQGDREIERDAQTSFEAGQLGPAATERFARDVIAPNIQDQLDRLRELTPPEGDEEEVDAIIDAAQTGVREIERDPGLVGEGDDAGGAFSDANRLAEEYGLTECGGG
jgi:hypothetical protein